ncbi:MAG TPA: DNA repair protein RadA [Candidatus Babeliales bacterium]|jgi:DNA repair protein RadA/Sms|nr:DNA repair protein RadA [Candidatus Babeliales bacterium]
MAKQKTEFQCAQCAHISIKWLGCCPECKEWNSFSERVISAPATRTVYAHAAALISLDAISTEHKQRLITGIGEWDRVMGGGIMPSSLIVLTGDPGIGKSTLLLQIAHYLATRYTVCYFSTEESLHQVKQRAQRLDCANKTALFSDQADLGSIIQATHEQKPDIIIIDSIQNCYISDTQTIPGSIAQLKEVTFQLMRLAKEHDITVIVTGHITKEGIIAGPKTLEHMVDAVFYLMGEDQWDSRILRAVKNRFGTTNEIGFFQMKDKGMIEVPNINEHLLKEASHAPGSALISVIEGSRPLLLELQALTIQAKIGIPQRVVSGLDHKQVVLIAAILEKYIHIKLSTHDIFFKVSGGFKIKESSTDLGIALALLSSYFQQPLPERSIALGEISLTGHIKPINHINTFIREAEKFGIARIMVAKNQTIDGTATKIQRFGNVYELLNLFEAP